MSHTGIVAILATLAMIAFGAMFTALDKPAPQSRGAQSVGSPVWETKARLLKRCAATLSDPTFVTNKPLRNIYDKHCL